MSKYLIGLLMLACLQLGSVRAEPGSPHELVQNVTEEVLSILRQDPDIKSGNLDRAEALVEKKVVPHFDFERMTSLAVGRAWQQASDTQRQALTQEFRRLLVRTYANSLTAYRNETVSFKAPRGDAGNEVTVRSQVNKPGAQPISLNYSLARTANGWKVFDVSIAEVSLVTNYRSSFASEVSQGGIEGLLKSLQEKNRGLETKSSTAP